MTRRAADGRFLNPDGSGGGKRHRDVLRLWLGQGARWPRRVENPPYPPAGPVPEGHVAITTIGHATALIRIAGGPTLLLDPVWSERASPFAWAGPRRVRAPGLAFEALPPIDAVLVTHNHYDHCDLATLRRLAARGAPPVVTGLGNAALIAQSGLTAVTELDWWQSHDLPGGVRITYLPMQHGSARNMRDRCRALWGGFAIETAEGARIFICGDTAWGAHLAEIGARLGPFAVALIPIGAYAPGWFMGSVHIAPEQAVALHHAIGARISVAMHWGVFRLSYEAIDEPPARIAAARGDADFRVPGFGETLMLPLDPQPSRSAPAM
jgi:L-ascorbate metabolism protein UlaG (beta-lactamase superfamily)